MPATATPTTEVGSNTLPEIPESVEQKNPDSGIDNNSRKRNDHLEFDDPSRPTDAKTDEPAPAGEATEGKAEGEKATFPKDLLARAESLGVSAEDIEELGTPESLTKVLEALEKRADSPDGGDEQIQEQPSAATEKAKLELDPEALGTEVVAALNTLNEHYAGQLAALTKEIATLRSAAEARDGAEHRARTDGYFDSLTEFQHVIGPDHPRNRGKVLERMKVLEAGYKAVSKKVPGERDLFDEAFRAAFGKEQAAVTRKQITDKLAKRESQITARPNRNVSDMTPEQRAIAAVAAAMRDKDEPNYQPQV